MELNQLRHFVAVAETGSFTRAAERCHITQPALSGSIGRLEEDLGVRLFVRTKRVVAMTEAGRKLLSDSLPILNACNRVRAEMRGTSGSTNLRLGLVRTFPTHKLTALLVALQADLAGLSLQITEGSASELDERLNIDKIDVALTTLDESQSDSVTELPLYRERYLVFAPSGHPLCAKREIVLEDLNGLNFIVRRSCETHASTSALMREKGVKPRVVCQTQQDERALELVRAGFGVALLPELFSADGVVKMPIKDFQANRTVGLKWHTAKNSETIERLCTFARTHPWQANS